MRRYHAAVSRTLAIAWLLFAGGCALLDIRSVDSARERCKVTSAAPAVDLGLAIPSAFVGGTFLFFSACDDGLMCGEEILLGWGIAGVTVATGLLVSAIVGRSRLHECRQRYPERWRAARVKP